MQIVKSYGIIMKLEFSRGGKTVLTPLPLLPNFRRKEPTMSENQNKLILLEDLGMIYATEKSKVKRRFGIYKCGYCGTEFKTRIADVKDNKTKSCGCHSKKMISISNTKHGFRKLKIYSSWSCMMQRVNDVNSSKYKNYGGRGIKVCDRWLDIKNFVEDMLPSYQEGLSIDRINNDGNYEPNNCRWATRTTQLQNTRVLRTTNTSGYRGVTYNKKIKKWYSAIMSFGKRKYLGSFNTAIEAAKAYNNYVIDNKLEHSINNI